MSDNQEPATKKARRGDDNAQLEAIGTAIDEIKEIQNTLKEINEKQTREILQIENQANAAKKPHYSKRAEFIKRIPDFWVNALRNFREFPQSVTEKDELVLESVTSMDITHEKIEDAFTLTFYFKDNVILKNKFVSKTIPTTSNEIIIASTPLEWHMGQEEVDDDDENTPVGFLHFLGDTTGDCVDIANALRETFWCDPLEYYMGGPEDEEGEDDEGEVDLDDEEFDDEEAELDAAEGEFGEEEEGVEEGEFGEEEGEEFDEEDEEEDN